MPACASGLQKHLLCKTIGHTATECPWLEEAKATTEPLFRYSVKMPACGLGLQKHLFQYSLKMPTCMIIFKILFTQKHCTLYLYSNGHVWIPIYEFEICVSVKKHANRTPTFGNGFGIQKRLQKAVQVSSILPWTSHGKNICFTELFVTILKRVVK